MEITNPHHLIQIVSINENSSNAYFTHRNRLTSGMTRCENRNIRGAASPRTQQIILILLLLVSVNSWVEKVRVSRSKSSLGIVTQSTILIKECSSRGNTLTHTLCRRSLFLKMASEAEHNDFIGGENDTRSTSQDNGTVNLQWQLFGKHHARFEKLDESLQSKTTSWVGKWVTYDYVGDVVLETMPASVNYISSSKHASIDLIDRVDVSHTISTGSTVSDCETCFDDPSAVRTIPITTYTPDNIIGKSRLGACGMVVGPSIMRSSGTMATELILAHTTSRIRIVFQHAPVWARGTEPGSCPPQGLKLVRCLLARETLETTSENSGASLSKTLMPGSGQHPIFDRSVPPFDWHKKWSGTSWTWGPEAGDRGWGIPELEIGVDDWHGCSPVEAWNMRLPGGIFIQLPRVVTGDVIERCRLAWMPNADTLLRFEAGLMALQPVLDDAEAIVGFKPPSLASLRCDVLQNDGDLEGVPSFVQQESGELSVGDRKSPDSNAEANETSQSIHANHEEAPQSSKIEDDDDSKRRATQNAFQL